MTRSEFGIGALTPDLRNSVASADRKANLRLIDELGENDALANEFLMVDHN